MSLMAAWAISLTIKSPTNATTYFTAIFSFFVSRFFVAPAVWNAIQPREAAIFLYHIAFAERADMTDVFFPHADGIHLSRENSVILHCVPAMLLNETQANYRFGTGAGHYQICFQ